VVDLNLDGLLDIVVVNRWTPAEVWRQTGASGGGWLQVRLQQDGANRDAIGAVVEVRRGDRVERHEVASGGGHVSGSVGWLHFGLGAAESVDLRVIWPGGQAGDWMALPANSFQTLSPGKAPEAWSPG
jgi:enediyne biosynthesis protein E4